MRGQALEDALGEVSRIFQQPIPMLAEPEVSDTLVTRPWKFDAIDAFVAPMDQHVLSPTHHGDGATFVNVGAKRIHEPSRNESVTLSPRGFSAHWRSTGRPTSGLVFLSDRRLQQCCDQVGNGQRPELLLRVNTPDAVLFRLLSLLCDEPESRDVYGRLCFERLLDALCIHLLRAHSAEPPPQQHKGALAGHQVRRVRAYLEEHLDEDVGVQELADLVGLSRFHFCTAFKRAAGYAPHQWLMRLRIERARQLLANTPMRVTDIALAVGYQNTSSFSEAFHKLVGVSPTVYRRSL